MKKTIYILLIMVLCITVLAACRPTAQAPAQTPAQTPQESGGDSSAPANAAIKFKVGVSVLDSANTLYAEIVQGIKDMLPEDADVTVADCQNNVTKQAQDVENLTAAGVDGIIILPAEPNALEASIRAAMDKDIMVISIFDRLNEYDSFAAFDPYTYGELLGLEAGKWIASELNGQAEVGMLTYNSMPAVQVRQQGMVDGMHEHAPDAEVVAQQDAAAPDEGMAVTESFLQAFPGMKVVMGINDGGAIGAFQAFVSANKAGPDVFVGGTDGLPQAYELMGQEGSIYRASVDAHPHDMGALCAQQLMLKMVGKPFEREPEVFLSVVTQDNLAEKLKEIDIIRTNGRALFDDIRAEILS
jgi:ribose transport system substrate-binding protein